METPVEKKKEDSESTRRALSLLCLWSGGGVAFFTVVFLLIGAALSPMADAPPDPSRGLSPMIGFFVFAILAYIVFLSLYLANSKAKRAPLFAFLSLAAPIALVILSALVR